MSRFSRKAAGRDGEDGLVDNCSGCNDGTRAAEKSGAGRGEAGGVAVALMGIAAVGRCGVDGDEADMAGSIAMKSQSTEAPLVDRFLH